MEDWTIIKQFSPVDFEDIVYMAYEIEDILMTRITYYRSENEIVEDVYRAKTLLYKIMNRILVRMYAPDFVTDETLNDFSNLSEYIGRVKKRIDDTEHRTILSGSLAQHFQSFMSEIAEVLSGIVYIPLRESSLNCHYNKTLFLKLLRQTVYLGALNIGAISRDAKGSSKPIVTNYSSIKKDTAKTNEQEEKDEAIDEMMEMLEKTEDSL